MGKKRERDEAKPAEDVKMADDSSDDEVRELEIKVFEARISHT